MAASNTRFTQNSLGQSKNPIDSDHGIYRYRRREFITLLGGCGVVLRSSGATDLWMSHSGLRGTHRRSITGRNRAAAYRPSV